MKTTDKMPGHTICTCPCHKEAMKVLCCACFIIGKHTCECGEKKRCCGDPIPPRRPEGSSPPGWRPGEKPPDDPFAGATGDDDRQRKFGGAVIDIIREGSTPRGPRFGPRKTEYLPYLLIRAFPGDRGSRPYSGVFWESPDIFVAPNLEASAAAATPTTLGGIAQAGAPNTLWSHVWNLGNAPVFNARVEFYWFDPSLGFSTEGAHLIGTTYVDLDNRTSGHAHAIVKCPETWHATLVNGGHECLVVRCFEPLTDPIALDQWNAWDDRHVGQRNISVVTASSPAELQLTLRLGCATAPGPATIEVVGVKASDVQWLSILTDKRKSDMKEAEAAKGVVGLMYPTLLRSSEKRPRLQGLSRESARNILQERVEFERGCDEQETIFYMHVQGLKDHECRVYRIMQKAGRQIVGGYTVIARKLQKH